MGARVMGRFIPVLPGNGLFGCCFHIGLFGCPEAPFTALLRGLGAHTAL